MVFRKYVVSLSGILILLLSAVLSVWAENSSLSDNDIARLAAMRGPVKSVVAYRNTKILQTYLDDLDPSSDDIDKSGEDDFGELASFTFDSQGRMLERIQYFEATSSPTLTSPRQEETREYDESSESIKVVVKVWRAEGNEALQEGSLLSQDDIETLYLRNDKGALVTASVTKYHGDDYEVSTVYYDINQQPWTELLTQTLVVRSSATGLTKTSYAVGHDSLYRIFHIHRLNEWGDVINTISFMNFEDETIPWIDFDDFVADMSFSYEYDEHQNWTKQFDAKTGELFQYREIKYYEE